MVKGVDLTYVTLIAVRIRVVPARLSCTELDKVVMVGTADEGFLILADSDNLGEVTHGSQVL